MNIDRDAASGIENSTGTGGGRKAPSSNAALLGRLFAALEKAEIPYCILRNFENLPDEIQGDIDILLGKNDLERCEAIIEGLIADFFRFRVTRKRGHVLYCISSTDEVKRAGAESRPAEVVILDLQTRLQWKGVAYLDAVSVLSSRVRCRGFYIPDPSHHASHVLCHAILDKNAIHSKHCRLLQKAAGEEAAGKRPPFEPLVPGLGRRTVMDLERACASGDPGRVLKLRQRVAKKLIFGSLKALPQRLSFMIKELARIGAAVLAPPGILIATLGPDGAGKSTIVDRTLLVLSGGFHPTRAQYMGWKEFILPTKKALRFISSRFGRSKPEKKGGGHSISRENLKWTHNLSLLHYFLDLHARYLLCIRPILQRGGLVVCDRYFYDFLARDVWISRNRLCRFCLLRLAPRPTLCVLLTGNPEEIARRKNEITPQEFSRQIEQFRAIRSWKTPVLELDASNAIEDNVTAVIRCLFEKPIGERRQ